MKIAIKPMYLVFFLMISFISCNNEGLFEEPISDVIIDETDTPEDDGVPIPPVSATPCDFNLATTAANSTVIINCVMDLGGKTINLPAGVTLVYEGGDIINGTINFGTGNVVSGELLNSSLTIGGTKPQLKDRTFNFDPKRWGIVEGKVSNNVANANSKIINQIIDLVKKLGVDTFKIDKMDAYFGVDWSDAENKYAIKLPSNFNLTMTKNTNIRVQPNGYSWNDLILCWDVDNVIISGGKLWGDRYTHDYKTITSTHEFGHLINFKAVHNGVVDNVEMHEAAGDGFHVAGGNDRNHDGSFKPNQRESFNITVKNCLIDDNRRQNITVADGTNIFIEYNTIRNAGSGDNSPGISSNGISPRSGIDIEARKDNAPDNNSYYDLEKTENIHIRHNIFEKNYAVDIALFNGEKAYIYENTFRSQRAIGASYSYNNKIYNNTFERPIGLMEGSQAINLEPVYWANGEDRIIDFEVNNNTFTGYQFAIVAGGQGNQFKNNTITNCKVGFVLLTSKDLVFDNNTISSNIVGSNGYYTFSSETYIKNCLIKNGATNVQGLALHFSNKNNNNIGDITIDNIVFNGNITLNNVNNTTVKNSKFNNIEIKNCNPTLINNN